MGKSFKLHITAVLLLIISVLIYFLLFGGVGQAYAATSAYSFVMDDLQKDSAFDASKYPKIAGDKSLQVIQIAESSESELFIYVYQPGGEGTGIKASSINIAKVPNDQLEEQSFLKYKLEYLNYSGVFFKYKVTDFELEKSDIRYYNISNILRPNKTGGVVTPYANTVSEIENRVGQLWTARTVDGKVEYFNAVSQVIEITDKFVGFLRYYDAQGWTGDYFTDSHFVAFSTDMPIDRLYDIDIEFVRQSRKKVYGGLPNRSSDDTETLGTEIKEAVTIKHDEVDHNSGNMFGYNKYTWDKIRTTSEFLKSESNSYYRITKNGSESLENTAWVVSFYTSSVKVSSTNGVPLTPSGFKLMDSEEAIFQKVENTKVSDVIILRLYFETDGVKYNLGAVDNVQTGDDDQINEPVPPSERPGLDFREWLAGKLNVSVGGAKAIVYGVIALIVLAILLPVLSAIFPAFGQVLLWVVKGLLFIISLPFRAIAALFKKRKESAPAKARSTSRPRKRNAGKTSRKKSAGTRRS